MKRRVSGEGCVCRAWRRGPEHGDWLVLVLESSGRQSPQQKCWWNFEEGCSGLEVSWASILESTACRKVVPTCQRAWVKKGRGQRHRTDTGRLYNFLVIKKLFPVRPNPCSISPLPHPHTGLLSWHPFQKEDKRERWSGPERFPPLSSS